MFRLGSSERHCSRCRILATYLAEGGSILQECITEQIATPNPYTSPLDDNKEQDLIPETLSMASEWMAKFATRIDAIFVLVTAPHLFILLAFGLVDLIPEIFPNFVAQSIKWVFRTFTDPYLEWLIGAMMCFAVVAGMFAYRLAAGKLIDEYLVLQRRLVSAALWLTERSTSSSSRGDA
ncbi:hypothetical protein CGZ80_27125 [Rhodopirellula sp. MGV]|nr:hypothetical protein CGZ80_27125 [Rhodopirellula sp. MGV]